MRLRRLRAVVGALSVALSARAETGDRVIVISCDGLRPDAITDATAPRLRELMQSGVSAREALCDLPAVTLPNHASMLTGLTSSRHDLLLNTELPGTIPQSTMLDFAAAAGLRTAFFVSKSKLLYLVHPETTETIVYESDTALLLERLLPLITFGGPDLIFLHLRDPDSTGHRFGWMSAEYLAAVTAMDALVGRIVDMVNTDSARHTYVIVTADHGGEGTTHFLNNANTRRIPWIAAGPGIAPATVLSQTVSTTDTAPTALWLLGLEAPPGLSGAARMELLDPPATPPDLSVPFVGPPCVLLMLSGLVVLGAAYRCRARPPGTSRAE
jgi:hypothetical protein